MRENLRYIARKGAPIISGAAAAAIPLIDDQESPRREILSVFLFFVGSGLTYLFVKDNDRRVIPDDASSVTDSEALESVRSENVEADEPAREEGWVDIISSAAVEAEVAVRS